MCFTGNCPLKLSFIGCVLCRLSVVVYAPTKYVNIFFTSVCSIVVYPPSMFLHIKSMIFDYKEMFCGIFNCLGYCIPCVSLYFYSDYIFIKLKKVCTVKVKVFILSPMEGFNLVWLIVGPLRSNDFSFPMSMLWWCVWENVICTAPVFNRFSYTIFQWNPSWFDWFWAIQLARVH